MKKIISVFTMLMATHSFAALPTYAHLGCQLDTGSAGVFHELRKFNISTLNPDYKRTLISFDGKKGECFSVEHKDFLECTYISLDNKEIKIYLNDFDQDTVEGTVYYDGWWDKTHKVSCDILTYKM